MIYVYPTNPVVTCLMHPHLPRAPSPASCTITCLVLPHRLVQPHRLVHPCLQGVPGPPPLTDPAVPPAPPPTEAQLVRLHPPCPGVPGDDHTGQVQAGAAAGHARAGEAAAGSGGRLRGSGLLPVRTAVVAAWAGGRAHTVQAA